MGGVSGWLVAQPSGYRKQRVPLMETNGFGSSGPGLGNKFPSDSTDPPPLPLKYIYCKQRLFRPATLAPTGVVMKMFGISWSFLLSFRRVEVAETRQDGG